jgi:hypothetical protein
MNEVNDDESEVDNNDIINESKTVMNPPTTNVIPTTPNLQDDEKIILTS